jgi:RNA polymerase sigma-70 factor (ECF subfamily)
MQDEPRPEDSTDAELLERIGAGAEEAFIEFYRRRRDDVFRFAYALGRSVSVAQDVTQEVFLNVLEHAARYDGEKGTVHAWLYGCARHVVVDRFRADRRLASGTAPEESVACKGEDEVFRDQQVCRLHAEIMQLPFEYREALVLCELAELSYAETAAVLACPIGTVRSRLHRARALLAEGLGAADSSAPALLKTTEACS